MDEVADYNEAAGDKKGTDTVIPDLPKGVVGIIAGYHCQEIAVHPDKASGNCECCRGINSVWPNWLLTLDIHFGYYWNSHDCTAWFNETGTDCHKWLRQAARHAEKLREKKMPVRESIYMLLGELDDGCKCGCCD